MKIQVRKDWGGALLYFLFTTVERAEGIASDLLDNDKHIILWDFDDMSLADVRESLISVKNKYKLGDIFIMSDKENSYRAMCFSAVDYREYLRILLDTVGVDWSFFKWLVKRDYATIRLTDKSGRKLPNDIISVISDNEIANIPVEVFNRIKGVWFEVDTGGREVSIGDLKNKMGEKS